MKKFDWNDYLFTKEEIATIKTKVRSVTDRYFDGVNGLIRLRKNDKGIALITVIVVVAVMSILVTTLLNVSLFSYQRKTTDYYAKDTFYDAEGAMDDIQVGLQSVVAANLSKISDSNAYVNGVLGSLNTGAAAKGSMSDYFASLVSADYKGTDTKLDVTVGSVAIDGNSVLIKDVTVGYTNANGYYSKIKTDIRIEAPQITLDEPVGSYSTIAGSGMVISVANTQNGLNDLAYCNFTGSIYVGYAEDEEDVAATYPNFEAGDWKHWNSVELPNYALITYSGSTVTINGNVYLNQYSTLRLDSQKVKIYGGIIMEPGAVLMIDDNTNLSCYGIYTVDENGNNIQAYTGDMNSVLNTVKDLDGNYTGHIPYTYPTIIDKNWYTIKKAGGNPTAAYAGLDTARIDLPSNWSTVAEYHNLSDNAICCYATRTPAFGNDNRDKNLSTMNTNLQVATVCIGTKCNEKNGYPVYSYAGQFKFKNSKGEDKTSDYDDVYTGLIKDYSGYAYPVAMDASGNATMYKYGDGGKTHVAQKSVSNITIDKSMTPVKKVKSRYASYTPKSGHASNFDAVVYDFIEMEYADAFPDNGYDTYFYNETTGKYQSGAKDSYKIGGNKIATMLESGVTQPINDGYISLYLSTGDAQIKDSNTYFRALAFASGHLELQIQNSKSLIVQSIVQQGEMDTIASYMNAYLTATTPEEEEAVKTTYAAGYNSKKEYDTWAKTSFRPTEAGASYYTSSVRDDLPVAFKWKSAFSDDSNNSTWVTYCKNHGFKNSSGSTVSTVAEADEHMITLDDFFKSGVKCLYMTQSQITDLEIKNATSFSVVKIENWERQ